VEGKAISPGGPGLIIAIPLALLLGLIALVMSIAALGAGSSGCGGTEVVGSLKSAVPKKLVPLYDEAAAKYHLGAKGPSVLAAINFVETSFGTNVATSTAGASGWMAFMPATWAEWGVDGNGDGTKDPYNAADAIFSAANYLHDSGAPGDWHGAIFAYNHVEWYVEKVLHYADQFGSGGRGPVEVASGEGCASVTAPNEAVAKMLAEAERLSALRPHTEYVWGGSHGLSPTPPNGPFDCSSAVSHLLQVAGFKNPTMDTIALLGWADPGPGRWVSIYDKPYGAEAHTFIEFMPGVAPPGERYWGTSGFVEPGHGPGFIPQPTFSASYLGGFQLLHPPGI
jgi:hypothetical protein